MADEFTNNVMKQCAEAIAKELFFRQVEAHFVVLVFTPGGVNYISNAERSSIKAAMEEVLGRWGETADEHNIES